MKKNLWAFALLIFMVFVTALTNVMAAEVQDVATTFETQRPQPETNEPLVMTKEELQAYFKRKGITPMTKERFKEPQRMAEINCGKDNKNCRKLSGLSSHKHVMAVSYEMGSRGTYEFDADEASLDFYGSKGLLKKVTFQNEYSQEGKGSSASETRLRVAQDGDYAAALRHEVTYVEGFRNQRHKYTLYYYDDSGNLLWRKDLGFGAHLEMSPDGKYVVVISGNWNLYGEGSAGPLDDTSDMGKGLNVMRLKIYNYKGDEVAAYKGFAGITGFSQYGFSGNSGFFYAFVDKIYEDNTPSSDLFLFFDLATGKLLIEKPIAEQLGRYYPIQRLNYNGDGFWMGDQYDLNGKVILKLPPKDYTPNVDLQDRYLELFTETPLVIANAAYNTILYDLADYISDSRKGERPTALVGSGSIIENGVGKYCVLYDKKRFTRICTYRDQKNIYHHVFKTLWGEDLWNVTGEGYYSNADYTYFKIDREVASTVHTFYYEFAE